MQESQERQARPKIKSSFGATLNKKQGLSVSEDTNTSGDGIPNKLVHQDTRIPEAQSPDISVAQSTKKQKASRTKKGVYLPPELAKWLDIQAATESKEISEITEESLVLLRKVRTGQVKIVEI